MIASCGYGFSAMELDAAYVLAGENSLKDMRACTQCMT
jgi:hypothetical protein